MCYKVTHTTLYRASDHDPLLVTLLPMPQGFTSRWVEVKGDRRIFTTHPEILRCALELQLGLYPHQEEFLPFCHSKKPGVFLASLSK
jgi:hypothetical protein